MEMFLRVLYLDADGSDINVATMSDSPSKFETRGFPRDHNAVEGIIEKYKKNLRHPLDLGDVQGEGFAKERRCWSSATVRSPSYGLTS